MAGSDIMGIVMIGVLLIGGYFIIQQNGGLQAILGQQQPAEAAPMPAEAEEPQGEPEQGQGEPEPQGPEMDIQPTVIPQYIPIPVAMPPAYGFRFPGYSRDRICNAEFGGSCNSECRYGPSQLCRDCVYFCGQPHYRRYPVPRAPYRPGRRYEFPRKPRVPIHTCDRDEHWDSNEGKCVKNHGGPGPVPGHDCPRGQRYNWNSKKCEAVPQPRPTPQQPSPEPAPSTPPAPTTTPADTTTPPRGTGKKKKREITKVSTPVQTDEMPRTAPAETNYAASYYGYY